MEFQKKTLENPQRILFIQNFFLYHSRQISWKNDSKNLMEEFSGGYANNSWDKLLRNIWDEVLEDFLGKFE